MSIARLAPGGPQELPNRTFNQTTRVQNPGLQPRPTFQPPSPDVFRSALAGNSARNVAQTQDAGGGETSLLDRAIQNFQNAGFTLGGRNLGIASNSQEAFGLFRHIVDAAGGDFDSILGEIGALRMLDRIREFIGKGDTLNQSGIINIGNGQTLESLRFGAGDGTDTGGEAVESSGGVQRNSSAQQAGVVPAPPNVAQAGEGIIGSMLRGLGFSEERIAESGLLGHMLMGPALNPNTTGYASAPAPGPALNNVINPVGRAAPPAQAPSFLERIFQVGSDIGRTGFGMPTPTTTATTPTNVMGPQMAQTALSFFVDILNNSGFWDHLIPQ